MTRTKAEIEEWCINYIADMFKISKEKIDTNAEFDSFGLDSTASVGLVIELEEWAGVEVAPSLLFEYPTISSLADQLAPKVPA